MTGRSARPADPPITRLQLFSTFLKIGLLGFGGVAAWARHVTVVERSWLSEGEFVELFALSSTLPGANTVNFATMFADRHAGALGVMAALAGLVGAPLCALVALATLYARFADLPDVRAGLAGAAAAAAGLVVGTSLNLLRGMRPGAVSLLVVAGVFAAAAWAGWSMLAILAVAVPVGLATAARRGRP